MRFLMVVYVFLFARPYFEKFNKLLFRLSLSGMGVLNYKNYNVSGEKNFIEKYLPNKKGVVVDVGANCGDYLLSLLAVNKQVSVYAFEPHPLTFTKLVKNTEEYKNVFTFNKGASSECGVLKLYDYAVSDGSEHASLFRNVISEIHGASSVTSHDVELITLDEFIDSENIDEILLLKIDTEGNELEVLRGCSRSIHKGKIKAIHFEFNEMNAISKVFFKDFWEILNDYDFYRLLPTGMIKIKKYSPLFCEIFAYQNIVAFYNK